MKAIVTIESGYPMETFEFDKLYHAASFAADAAKHIVQDKDTKVTVHIELEDKDE